MAYQIGGVKLSRLEVALDTMTVGAVCSAAAICSKSLGNELKPLQGLTCAACKFHDIFKVKGDVTDLTNALGLTGAAGAPIGKLNVAKRVAFLAIGIMVTVKILVVKLGVGMNWCKANAPRFARIISSKAFPQVLCIVSIFRTTCKIICRYNSADDKIRDKFYSDAAKDICFIGIELAENLPLFTALKGAQGVLFVGGVFFGSLRIGQV